MFSRVKLGHGVGLRTTHYAQFLEERPEVAAEFSRTLALRRVDLTMVLEGLDAEAKRARVATEETRILDRIQEFFGLARTTSPEATKR